MNQYYSTSLSVGILSIIKLLERFSYYGMRSIIILYALDEMDFNRGDAITYYAVFTAGVYLIQFPMGLLSDLIFKQKNGIIIGMALLIIGYGLLVMTNVYAIAFALFLILLGVGLVNPNAAVLLGRLYRKQDKNRNISFVIYLLAINIGAFLSSIVMVFVSNFYGFRFGFILAGVVALIALIIFLATRNKFELIEGEGGRISKEFPIDDHPEILDYSKANELALSKSSPPPLPFKQKMEHLIGRHVLIFGIAAATVIFWQFYEISSLQMDVKFGIRDFFSTLGMPSLNTGSLQAMFTVPVTMVILVLLFFKKMRSSINMIGVGFVLIAISILPIYFVKTGSTIATLSAVFPHLLIFSFAEIFITAITLSYVTRLSTVKFSSSVVGLFSLITGMGMSLFSYFNGFMVEANLLILAIVPLMIGVLFLVLRKPFLQFTGGID